MSELVPYKNFSIRPFERAGRWLAEIRKADESSLFVDLPASRGPQPSLTTEPPTYSKEAAINLAKQAIDGSSIK